MGSPAKWGIQENINFVDPTIRKGVFGIKNQLITA